MGYKILFFFRRLDLYLLGIAVAMASLGIVMIYSTTFSFLVSSDLVVRQLIFFLLGLGAMFALASLNYRLLRTIAPALYLSGVALLIGVLFFGRVVGGSESWFDLGFFRFQPVEYMKLALIVQLAAFFQRRLPEMLKLRNLIFSFLIAAVPVALTLMQPDLGSASVLGFIWLGMLLAARPKKSHLLWLFFILILLAGLAWQFLLYDYQKDRIVHFWDPMSDPQGRGYNALQAMTAVGSGGVSGYGLARGLVSQLRFLPERQTDFIFASLGEELGLVGTVALLGFVSAWLIRITRVIRDSRENFGFYLGLGIFCLFFFQSFVNIGMNIGLLPITGIPLPFVSYGGSSLVISFISLGILQSVSVHSQSALVRD